MTQIMLTAATVSKTVVRKVVETKISKDNLVQLACNLAKSCATIGIPINVKKELANCVESVLLHFEFTGNEELIYTGV